MKYTENYGFDKPEGTDFVDVEHFNANTEQLDKLLCPEYTEEKTIAELQSGEKLSTAFGKLAKAVKDLISHLADEVKHITSDERTLWNTVSNKADSNHTHKYAGSSSAGGAANSAKTLYHTRYIDGIPFDGSSNLSRLGTCTTATYMADKEVAISAFDDEGAQDAILYIQFTATYEGALNDAHAISINGGEPLTIYYKGEVFNWETYFSNYPFCEGQIHQFRYFWTPMGSYLELIAVQNRAVANNLTTTNEKIALAAPMGKQLAETDASLQEQISTLNSNMNISVQRYTMKGITVDLSTMPNGIYITTLTNLTASGEIGALAIIQKSNSSTVYMTILSKTTLCDDWSVTRNGAILTLSGTNLHNDIKWSLALISIGVI